MTAMASLCRNQTATSKLEVGCSGHDPFARRNPGLKSETWATHSSFVCAIFIFLGKGRRPIDAQVGMTSSLRELAGKAQIVASIFETAIVTRFQREFLLKSSVQC